MPNKNIFYGQSGGVTAVINATACGVIETVQQYPQAFGKVYAGRNGITGALNEELIDLSQENPADIAALKHTPGAAFGSCRYKLKPLTHGHRQFARLIEVCAAHDIGYFFYNGGGDSQDTTYKVSQISKKMGYPLTCIGIPKTIDNDLVGTDNCPGFGSAAKYIATSIQEASLDIASMCNSSTKVFVMEVMGRHAGWLAAAACLAKRQPHEPPHMILLPEIAFDQMKFLAKVQHWVETQGYCVIVASEGIRYPNGVFVSSSRSTDAFGHTQLGGVAPDLAKLVKHHLGYKYHWSAPDYLQRSARHLASALDVEQAYSVGQAAVEFALEGKNAVMPTIIRCADQQDYAWQVGEIPLAEVANKERKMPRDFISKDGFGINAAGRAYLQPLIVGESHPPYRQGIPHYACLKKVPVEKKLITDFQLT